MDQFWAGFMTAMGLVVMVLVVGGAIKGRNLNDSFRGITSKVVVYEKYEAGSLEGKKAAVESATKLLESNGYVVGYIEGTDFGSGNRFLQVVGSRNVK